MNASGVPRIFDPHRRALRERRALARLRAAERGAGERAGFLWQDIREDMIDRLGFVRQSTRTALLVGDPALEPDGFAQAPDDRVDHAATLDIERPFGDGLYEFIGIGGVLDAVNDLPGALIHVRNALVPGGLAIVSFVGGASLPRLRAVMLAADGERPAARLHPMVDPRAAPQLLQRAGWKDPVVDTHRLNVRYGSLDRLVSDLRDHGLTNALADRAPPLGKAAFVRARSAFLDQADADGRVTETFEIVTLTGRRSLGGT
ncbi:MAG: methyltransferase [Erythrobacter sp.]|jgi:hypothetical protein|nr:methyltransferase [Erythrobacter sp.]